MNIWIWRDEVDRLLITWLKYPILNIDSGVLMASFICFFPSITGHVSLCSYVNNVVIFNHFVMIIACLM